MINLFNRVYIALDNQLFAANNQARLVISDKDFGHAFTEDAAEREQIRLTGVYKDLADADEKLGDRNAVWHVIKNSAVKQVVICSHKVFVELMVQYWKSVLAKPTAASCYRIYKAHCSNERVITMLSTYQKNLEEIQRSVPESYAKYTYEEFAKVYDDVEACDMLKTIGFSDFPVEHQLASFLSGHIERDESNLFKANIKKIILENIASKLAGLREEFFTESHSYYSLFSSSEKDPEVSDPFDMIAKYPTLHWVLDHNITADNTDYIVKAYTPDKMVSMFEQYEHLMREKWDEKIAAEYLSRNDVAGLLKYDVTDEKGNFIASENFLHKVNGLFVSIIYQLARQENKEALKCFALK